DVVPDRHGGKTIDLPHEAGKLPIVGNTQIVSNREKPVGGSLRCCRGAGSSGASAAANRVNVVCIGITAEIYVERIKIGETDRGRGKTGDFPDSRFAVGAVEQ